MSYGRDAISDKLIWNSSDPSLASVDQVGTITTYEKEGADGRLELDEEENVIDYPDLENIESIHSDVENILKNYPAVVKISHGKGRIAPHWAVTKFVPEVFFESVCCMQGIIPGSRLLFTGWGKKITITGDSQESLILPYIQTVSY